MYQIIYIHLEWYLAEFPAIKLGFYLPHPENCAEVLIARNSLQQCTRICRGMSTARSTKLNP